jgi:inner membrane protein YidH
LTQDEADATRRTVLANERTALAWWRTGLTALAVALAVGRVVPELGDSTERWPYSIAGIGFALYAVAMIYYGTARSRAVMTALDRGDPVPPPDRAINLLTAAGVLLALLTAALIAID